LSSKKRTTDPFCSPNAIITATGLAPPNDFESAIAGTLEARDYTVIVRGFNNAIGVALVEVYALD
jgi:hypothetical protein